MQPAAVAIQVPEPLATAGWIGKVGVPTPVNIGLYQPKDLNRIGRPVLSTFRDKNGWIRAKTA